MIIYDIWFDDQMIMVWSGIDMIIIIILNYMIMIMIWIILWIIWIIHIIWIWDYESYGIGIISYELNHMNQDSRCDIWCKNPGRTRFCDNFSVIHLEQSLQLCYGAMVDLVWPFVPDLSTMWGGPLSLTASQQAILEFWSKLWGSRATSHFTDVQNSRSAMQ